MEASQIIYWVLLIIILSETVLMIYRVIVLDRYIRSVLLKLEQKLTEKNKIKAFK